MFRRAERRQSTLELRGYYAGDAVDQGMLASWNDMKWVLRGKMSKTWSSEDVTDSTTSIEAEKIEMQG